MPDPDPPEITHVTVLRDDGSTVAREPTLEDILLMAPVIAADWRSNG